MTEDKKFGQSILDKIREKGLLPKPKWRFLFKNYVVWGFGFLSLLIGSMAMAVILYMFCYNDWGIHKELNQSFLSYVIISLPYFWLIFLGLFIFVVYYNFKHTKHGYRYGLPLILGGSVLASAAMGMLLFGVGLGEAIDDVLSRQTPFYEKIINHRIGMWETPENGRLAGMVLEKKDNRLLLIFALDKRVWQVDIENARIMAPEEPAAGRPIKDNWRALIQSRSIGAFRARPGIFYEKP
jgi:hypothetical protein